MQQTPEDAISQIKNAADSQSLKGTWENLEKELKENPTVADKYITRLESKDLEQAWESFSDEIKKDPTCTISFIKKLDGKKLVGVWESIPEETRKILDVAVEALKKIPPKENSIIWTSLPQNDHINCATQLIKKLGTDKLKNTWKHLPKNVKNDQNCILAYISKSTRKGALEFWKGLDAKLKADAGVANAILGKLPRTEIKDFWDKLNDSVKNETTAATALRGLQTKDVKTFWGLLDTSLKTETTTATAINKLDSEDVIEFWNDLDDSLKTETTAATAINKLDSKDVIEFWNLLDASLKTKAVAATALEGLSDPNFLETPPHDLAEQYQSPQTEPLPAKKQEASKVIVDMFKAENRSRSFDEEEPSENIAEITEKTTIMAAAKPLSTMRKNDEMDAGAKENTAKQAEKVAKQEEIAQKLSIKNKDPWKLWKELDKADKSLPTAIEFALTHAKNDPEKLQEIAEVAGKSQNFTSIYLSIAQRTFNNLQSSEQQKYVNVAESLATEDNAKEHIGKTLLESFATSKSLKILNARFTAAHNLTRNRKLNISNDDLIEKYRKAALSLNNRNSKRISRYAYNIVTLGAYSLSSPSPQEKTIQDITKTLSEIKDPELWSRMVNDINDDAEQNPKSLNLLIDFLQNYKGTVSSLFSFNDLMRTVHNKKASPEKSKGLKEKLLKEYEDPKAQTARLEATKSELRQQEDSRAIKNILNDYHLKSSSLQAKIDYLNGAESSTTDIEVLQAKILYGFNGEKLSIEEKIAEFQEASQAFTQELPNTEKAKHKMFAAQFLESCDSDEKVKVWKAFSNHNYWSELLFGKYKNNLNINTKELSPEEVAKIVHATPENLEINKRLIVKALDSRELAMLPTTFKTIMGDPIKTDLAEAVLSFPGISRKIGNLSTILNYKKTSIDDAYELLKIANPGAPSEIWSQIFDLGSKIGKDENDRSIIVCPYVLRIKQMLEDFPEQQSAIRFHLYRHISANEGPRATFRYDETTLNICNDIIKTDTDIMLIKDFNEKYDQVRKLKPDDPNSKAQISELTEELTELYSQFLESDLYKSGFAEIKKVISTMTENYCALDNINMDLVPEAEREEATAADIFCKKLELTTGNDEDATLNSQNLIKLQGKLKTYLKGLKNVSTGSINDIVLQKAFQAYRKKMQRSLTFKDFKKLYDPLPDGLKETATKNRRDLISKLIDYSDIKNEFFCSIQTTDMKDFDLDSINSILQDYNCGILGKKAVVHTLLENPPADMAPILEGIFDKRTELLETNHNQTQLDLADIRKLAAAMKNAAETHLEREESNKSEILETLQPDQQLPKKITNEFKQENIKNFKERYTYFTDLDLAIQLLDKGNVNVISSLSMSGKVGVFEKIHRLGQDQQLIDTFKSHPNDLYKLAQDVFQWIKDDSTDAKKLCESIFKPQTEALINGITGNEPSAYFKELSREPEHQQIRVFNALGEQKENYEGLLNNDTILGIAQRIQGNEDLSQSGKSFCDKVLEQKFLEKLGSDEYGFKAIAFQLGLLLDTVFMHMRFLRREMQTNPIVTFIDTILSIAILAPTHLLRALITIIVPGTFSILAFGAKQLGLNSLASILKTAGQLINSLLTAMIGLVVGIYVAFVGIASAIASSIDPSFNHQSYTHEDIKGRTNIKLLLASQTEVTPLENYFMPHLGGLEENAPKTFVAVVKALLLIKSKVEKILKKQKSSTSPQQEPPALTTASAPSPLAAEALLNQNNDALPAAAQAPLTLAEIRSHLESDTPSTKMDAETAKGIAMQIQDLYTKHKIQPSNPKIDQLKTRLTEATNNPSQPMSSAEAKQLADNIKEMAAHLIKDEKELRSGPTSGALSSLLSDQNLTNIAKGRSVPGKRREVLSSAIETLKTAHQDIYSQVLTDIANEKPLPIYKKDEKNQHRSRRQLLSDMIKDIEQQTEPSRNRTGLQK